MVAFSLLISTKMAILSIIGTRTSRILYYENRDPITTGLKQVDALRGINLDPRKAPLALMEEAVPN